MPEDAFKHDLIDRDNYLFKWLSAGPSQLRSAKSPEIDFDKRLEALLGALHKEDNKNVLRLKPRGR